MELVLMKIKLDIKMSELNQNTFQHQFIQWRESQQDSLKLIQHQLHLQQRKPHLQKKPHQPQLRKLHQPQQKKLHQPQQRKLHQQKVLLQQKKEHQKNNQDLRQRLEINLQMLRKSLPQKLQLTQRLQQDQLKLQHQNAQKEKFATNMILKPSITKNHLMELALMKIELDIKMSVLNQSMFQHQSIQPQILQLNSLKLIQHQLHQRLQQPQQPQLKMLLQQPQQP